MGEDIPSCPELVSAGLCLRELPDSDDLRVGCRVAVSQHGGQGRRMAADQMVSLTSGVHAGPSTLIVLVGLGLLALCFESTQQE